jgi:hypothetical protein
VEEQPDEHREQDGAALEGVDEREEHEAPDADADRAHEVERTAPDPVGERAEERDQEELQAGAEEQRTEDGVLGCAEVGRHVGDDDDREDVVRDVLGHPHAHGEEHLPGVPPDDLEDRQVPGATCLDLRLGLGEHR